MGDTFATTPYTLDADGRMGANYEGHIHAAGVDLDAGVDTAPPADRKVRWLRQSDGSVTAELAAFDSAGDAQLTLASRGVPGGGAAASLIARTADGIDHASLDTYVYPGGSSVAVNARDQRHTLLDDGGYSDWLLVNTDWTGLGYIFGRDWGDGVFGPGEFRVVGRTVELRGVVRTDSRTVAGGSFREIADVPAGYWRRAIGANSNGGQGRIDVVPYGTGGRGHLELIQGSGGGSSLLLDGLSYTL